MTRGRSLRMRCCWIALAFLGLAMSFAAACADDPWAPFDVPWFDRLGISDGLPHSIVTSLAQDQRGLMWVGTMGGLVRYDGYRMQVFSGTSGTAADLPDTYVRALLPLADGGMLIGTSAGGLSRFDPIHASFHNYPIGPGGTDDRKIYAMARDGDTGVWIATERGLDHLDLRTDTLTAIATGTGTSRNFSVLQDREGNLWLGNNNGLLVRYAGSKTFVRPPRPQGNIASVLNDGIWALYEDREGRLWAGSTRTGAVYRDRDGQWHEVADFSGYPQDRERRPTVRDFLEVVPNKMWMATDGGGVMVYSPGAADIIALKHDAALPSSLPGDSIRALMQDRAGNLWAATDLGVAHTQPNARSAFALLPATQQDRSLADTNVHGIYVDSRKRIWLGLSAGRIDMIDLEKARIQHFLLSGNQAHRDVQAFVETPDGTLWVGAQGLARIALDTLTVQNSVVPALDEKPVLYLRSEGQQLLIATYEGVYRYNTQTRALTHFEQAANDPSSLASNTVRRIMRIDNKLGYLTARGLSIAANADQTKQFENLLVDPDDPTGLLNNLTGSAAVDPRGNLWMGTHGGLTTLAPSAQGQPDRFQSIGVAQGLSSGNVNGVESDDHGNLWVSLPNGIAKIDAATHAVHDLDSRDGLHIYNYIYVAAAQAPTGELLFGGLDGLTVVRPHWQPPVHDTAPLVVTYATLNGVALPVGQLPRADQTLKLKPDNRSLRLDFALLDYQAPSEVSYSYRMDGTDDEWIDVPRGSLPTAIYTNLPYGDYTLRLRARTLGLQPRVVETSFQVSAEPRWYETRAAIIGAGAMALIVLLGAIQLRTLYLRRQAVQLQQQIDIHTHDLMSANQRLDELASTDELTGVYRRRRFLEIAEGIRRMASDGGACIALLDLDHFKHVNDSYGHFAGDAVIRAACQSVLLQCRGHDVVGRYGGEELMVCLPDGTLEQGMAVAERIRQGLADSSIPYEEHFIKVTASIGVAVWREGETLSQWLTRADDALFEAKRAGRNRCVAAS